MIKKLKIGLLSLTTLALALSAGVGSASAAAVNFTKDTNITVGSRSYYITEGSAATTFTVNAGTFVVTVPVSSTLTFVSNQRDTLVASDSSAVSCNLANSTVTITGAGTSTTITPSSTVCGPSGGGGGGGGGGGSSSSSSTTTTTTTTSTTTSTVIPGCNGKVGFSTVNGQSCATNTAPATTTTTSTSTTPPTTVAVTSVPVTPPVKAITEKSSKTEIKSVQTELNKALGLKLKVSGTLDKATIAAVKAFQKKNKLKADGVIGPTTRAKLDAVK